jgi:hypothetical protein
MTIRPSQMPGTMRCSFVGGPPNLSQAGVPTARLVAPA